VIIAWESRPRVPISLSGLALPGEFRWLWRHPGLVARGLFAVLIAVPALAIVVTRAFDLAWAADTALC
jgi:hypothetical protein